ncbi:MAG: hypothetical protein ACOC3X_01910 [Nanoarchaeota archaeon]
MNEKEINKILDLPRKELFEKIKLFTAENRIIILKKLKEKEEKQKNKIDDLLKESIKEKNISNIVSNVKILKDEKSNLNDLLNTEEIKINTEDKEQQFTSYSSKKDENLEYIFNIYDELKEITNNPGYDSIQRAEEIYNKIMNSQDNLYNESFKQLANGSRKLMKDLKGDYISQVGYNK